MERYKRIFKEKKDITDLKKGDKITLKKGDTVATVDYWIDQYKTKLQVIVDNTKEERVINLNAIKNIIS